MGKNYNHEIGYETLLADFKRYQKQSPKGVSLRRTGNNIYLKFKVGNKTRKDYGCNCSFTLDGMVSALSKARKVADALKSLKSESEFWEWYNYEIKDIGKIENDLLTFRDAIALIETDFWERHDRRKQKRDKNNPSDLSSWNEVYYRFYKHLPQNKAVNLKNIQQTLERWNKGTKSYKSAVSVFKKLARVANKESITEALDKLDVTQTEFNELQSATLDDFLKWRDRVLGITTKLHPNSDLDVRKAWLWVFSIQAVYGLRIHEVFAIQNLDKPFTTKDKVPIPALNDANNKDNLLVIGKKTQIGTKTKTHYRLARPLLPNNYLDLIERLEIKNPLLPSNKPIGDNPNTIRKFYTRKARTRLLGWNAPFTQTHSLRHLANLNGMQSGISSEVRAQSLGHTVAMNDSTYKKRQHTKTTIDILLNSNKQAIDFTSGLLEAKQIIKKYPNSEVAIVELISKIYQKSETEIENLLS
jgi:hypothetical protein